MKEVKVKWFGYMEPIDEDINTFLAMNKIEITKQDLVKNMSDDQKHRLTLSCQLHDISIEETLDLMERVANKSINDALALTKLYLESPAGKDYLEKRKEIEEIGMGMK